MAKAKKLKASPIHEILPQEIFIMILKKLDFQSVSIARGTCKQWKNFIEVFKLVGRKFS